MIEKIFLPKDYSFLVDKIFMEKFLNGKGFLRDSGKIEKIEESSVMMGSGIKVFIKYQISDGEDKYFLRAIRRFGGFSKEEFELLKFLDASPSLKGKFSLPKPFYYFKKEKILLFRGAPGLCLSSFPAEYVISLLEGKIASFIDLLFFLQKEKPAKGKWKISREEDKAKKFTIDFVKFFPEKEKEIKEIIAEIFKNKKAFLNNKKGISFVHGDFTFGNIIWDEPKNIFGLIDFSESRFDDSSVDLGTFLGQLDYLAFISKQELRIKNIEESIKEKYFSLIKDKISKEDFCKKISIYRAWGNIQNAVFILGAQSERQNKEGCLYFLDLASSILNKF